MHSELPIRWSLSNLEGQTASPAEEFNHSGAFGEGTDEQVVSHLKRELELNDLETPDELQINTVTQRATQENPEKRKLLCHHCKTPGHYRNQGRQLKQEKTKHEKRRKVLTKTTIMIVIKQTLTPTINVPKRHTQTIQIIKKTGALVLSTYSVRLEVKLTIPQRNAISKQKQLIAN